MVAEANSLAYSHWCRLYLTVVNEKQSDLTNIKNRVYDSKAKLEALISELLYRLNCGEVTFPDPMYFMVGATARFSRTN